jgi:hypothetical protein
MNQKHFFTMIVLLEVLFVASVSPAAVKASGSQSQISEDSGAIMVYSDPAAQPINSEPESRRWSGVIFLSDSNYPDLIVSKKTATPARFPESGCMPEDSLSSPHHRLGGCIE